MWVLLTVEGARELLPANKKGTSSNAFCVVVVLPPPPQEKEVFTGQDVNETEATQVPIKHKTITIANTLNPIWNTSFTIPFPPERRKLYLRIECWHRHKKPTRSKPKIAIGWMPLIIEAQPRASVDTSSWYKWHTLLPPDAAQPGSTQGQLCGQIHVDYRIISTLSPHKIKPFPPRNVELEEVATQLAEIERRLREYELLAQVIFPDTLRLTNGESLPLLPDQIKLLEMTIDNAQRMFVALESLRLLYIGKIVENENNEESQGVKMNGFKEVKEKKDKKKDKEKDKAVKEKAEESRWKMLKKNKKTSRKDEEEKKKKSEEANNNDKEKEKEKLRPRSEKEKEEKEKARLFSTSKVGETSFRRVADDTEEEPRLSEMPTYGYTKEPPGLLPINARPEDVLRRIDLDLKATARLLVRLKVAQSENHLHDRDDLVHPLLPVSSNPSPQLNLAKTL